MSPCPGSRPPSGDPSSRGSRTDTYTGPDYAEALRSPLDPLVHPDPRRPPLAYRVLHPVVRTLLRLLFRYRVRGLENLPAPPFIVAANHQAWYDAAFVIAALPSRPMVYTMARRDTVFDKAWKRWLLPRIGVFPIQPHQGELDRSGVTTVYQLLGRGGVVLIFPEGRYSKGPRLRPLKKGVAHFALQAGVPICPVAVSGLGRLRPWAQVEVSIGPPIWPDPPAWWTLNRRVARLLGRLRRTLQHHLGEGAPAATEAGGGARQRLRDLRRALGWGRLRRWSRPP